VKSIYEDREGSLWIGTGSGLNRLRDGKFTVYTTKEGLSNDMVWSIYEDREGSLWIGTWRGGLNRLKNGKFTGSLWIGTDGGGLNRLRDGKGQSLDWYGRGWIKQIKGWKIYSLYR